MKRRALSTLLAFIMALSLLPGTALAVTVASGKCGDNATWSLDDAGVLTVSGTGAMKDYGSANSTPWYARRNDVTKIIVGNGITSVGTHAFTGCQNTNSAEIGNSVISIKKWAFSDCRNLSSVKIPLSMASIDAAFLNCSRIRTINYAGTEAQWNEVNINYQNYANLFG